MSFLTINDKPHYLLPIFAIGKYYKQNDKTLLSLSIRVHHQLCGAYHVSHFINELQIMINEHKFIKE